jgi:photosystem II stability/assembly factor-like uncharacterized protein
LAAVVVLGVALALLWLAQGQAWAAEDGWAWFRQNVHRIRRVVPSPNYAIDHALFGGLAMGDEGASGVLKSTDAGLTWQASNDGLDDRMRALYLSAVPGPTSSGTLVLTIIRRTYGKVEKAAGIYASTDGGATWAPRLENMDAWDLLSADVSPGFATDGIMLLGIRAKGLYRSGDGGKSIKLANQGLSTLYPYGIAFTPTFAQDATVFVVTEGGGVYRSTDKGLSWTGVTNGIDDLYVYSVAVSPSYAQDKTVIVGGSQGSVFVSADGGQTWKASSDGISDPRLTTIAFSPDFARNRTIYVGSETGGIFRSTDGGMTWTKLDAPFNAEIFSIVPLRGPNGDTLVVTVSDGGIWLYTRPVAGSPLAATATARAAVPTPGPRPTATSASVTNPAGGPPGASGCLTYVITGPAGIVLGLTGGMTVLSRRRARRRSLSISAPETRS